jgi:hypothetical protein
MFVVTVIVKFIVSYSLHKVYMVSIGTEHLNPSLRGPKIPTWTEQQFENLSIWLGWLKFQDALPHQIHVKMDWCDSKRFYCIYLNRYHLISAVPETLSFVKRLNFDRLYTTHHWGKIQQQMSELDLQYRLIKL